MFVVVSSLLCMGLLLSQAPVRAGAVGTGFTVIGYWRLAPLGCWRKLDYDGRNPVSGELQTESEQRNQLPLCSEMTFT